MTVELEPAQDALAQLEGIERALVSRHGQACRALQRRIETAVDGGDLVVVHDQPLQGVDGPIFVAVPSSTVAELLAEARRLGVTPRR